jgi:hypothetical protein
MKQHHIRFTKRMKSEFHNKWKKFLTEDGTFTHDKNAGPVRLPFDIYCDMDGVLVDLIGGIEDSFKTPEYAPIMKEPKNRAAIKKILFSGKEWLEVVNNADLDPASQEVLERMFGEIKNILGGGHEWWSGLPRTSGAEKLWAFIQPLGAKILSAPWRDDLQGSKLGKLDWLSPLGSNLIPPPKEAIITPDKAKYAINRHTGQCNVLIDDMDRYLMPWAQAQEAAVSNPDSGVTGPSRWIKYTSADEAIRQLKEMIEDVQR